LDSALIIPPAAAIIGTAVGSTIQFWFSRRSEGRRRIEEQRLRAYVDFVNGLSQIAMAQKNDDKKREIESNIVLSDAKTRIGLYGRREVIQSLAQFVRKHGAQNSPEALSSFTTVVEEMRLDARDD
jgi:hypothetical protein